MKKITVEELSEMFDAEEQDKLAGMFFRSDVTAIVVFQNQMMDSSRFGESTAVAIGPGCTYKTLEDIRGRHLGDVPSRFQHPIAYVEK